MHVVFRCDASLEIGTGHVMRCLTLAQALRIAGATCQFISRALPGHLGDRIAAYGFKLTLLPPPQSSAPKGPPAHASWAGVGWEQDAAETSAALHPRPDWLVIDHYAFDARWHCAALPKSTRLMVIDDLADRMHECDLLLDQNLGRHMADYDALVPASCKRLIGPEFSLLRPEFAALRHESMARRRQGCIRRILVAMGGVDVGNHMSSILQAIDSLPQAQEFAVTLTISARATHLPELRQSIQSLRFATDLLVDAHDMARIMCAADMAITASGIMAYELTCMGVPMLLLPVSDIQLKVAHLLAKLTAAHVVEDWQCDPASVIAAALASWLRVLKDENPSYLQVAFDGLGTQRVVSALIRQPLDITQ